MILNCRFTCVPCCFLLRSKTIVVSPHIISHCWHLVQRTLKNFVSIVVTYLCRIAWANYMLKALQHHWHRPAQMINYNMLSCYKVSLLFKLFSELQLELTHSEHWQSSLYWLQKLCTGIMSTWTTYHYTSTYIHTYISTVISCMYVWVVHHASHYKRPTKLICLL